MHNLMGNFFIPLRSATFNLSIHGIFSTTDDDIAEILYIPITTVRFALDFSTF